MTQKDAARLALEAGFSAAFLCPLPDGEWGSAAKSALLMATPLDVFSDWPEGYAEVSAYYFQSQRAHEAMRNVAETLRAKGVWVETKHALRLKPLGQAAGLGLTGRNTLLRNNRWGSSFTMRALLTDVEPQEGTLEGFAAHPCGECRRCVDACPTKALSLDKGFTRALCLRHHMMSGEVVPEAMRKAMGMRLLGCEICQRACPHNAGARAVPPDAEPFALNTLLRLNAEDLLRIARRIGSNEARKERLLAQTALVAGNSVDGTYAEALEALLTHPREAVRVHARWALDMIKGG